MKLFYRYTFCLFAAIGLAERSHSAELGGTNQPSASMEAVVAEILQSNPELKFYEAEIQAAKGERRLAGSFANPEIATELGRKSVRGGGLSDEGVAWSVSLRQSFEWPGRLPLRKAIANQQIKLAELGYGQFRAALTAKARTLSYNLFAAQQKAAAAREVADRLRTLREVLVQRDPAGLTPELELRIIEATELTLQRKATSEALAAKAALLELNQIRGTPWDAALAVTEPALEFAPPPTPESLVDSARTNNFELQMRKSELEQQGFRVSLARNERFPAISAGPFFSQERAGDTENIVGIGLSIPVPLWNRNQGSIAAAQARELQAQTSLFVTQREIERKVLEERARYETKVTEMSNWRPDSVNQFRQAAALADRHYRLGAVPIATYVELQKQYLEAVETLLETKREALEAGEQLQLLTGMDFRNHHAPSAQ